MIYTAEEFAKKFLTKEQKEKSDKFVEEQLAKLNESLEEDDSVEDDLTHLKEFIMNN